MSQPSNRRPSLPTIGWREWVTLSQLGIGSLKAKIDTGARSSALHAFDIEKFMLEGKPMVAFSVHPAQRDSQRVLKVHAELVDERVVTNSGGQASERPVIITEVGWLGVAWPIELTLVRRDLMGFRLLLGRQAVRHRFVVDPGGSYLGGRPGAPMVRP